MYSVKLGLLAAATLGLSALPAAAQTPAPAGSTSTRDQPASDMTKAPASKMSEADMRTWNRCKALSKDAMMKDAECARLAKAHSDKLKADGAPSETMKDDGVVKK